VRRKRGPRPGIGGNLAIDQRQPSDLAEFIDIVHRTAGLPFGPEWGAGIMGVVSALYFVALISGIIILWPTLFKDFFAFRVGPQSQTHVARCA